MIAFHPTTDRPLVVFSDLDGTLIDHHTYSIEESLTAIGKLIKRRIPLVFCSSKTFKEQVQLQYQIGIQWPFIFENGSAVAIPNGFFPKDTYTAAGVELGYDLVIFAHADAASLRATLIRIPGIRGYADAFDAELSVTTGLTGEALRNARARWFTETLITPLNEIRAAWINRQLKPDGFVLSRGGRFHTVQSAWVNKGKAVEWMKEIFCRTSRQAPRFAAIGDSLNDVQMLEVVERPFLVQGPQQTWVEMEIPQLIRIPGIGPAGFSEAIRRLLEE